MSVEPDAYLPRRSPPRTSPLLLAGAFLLLLGGIGFLLFQLGLFGQGDGTDPKAKPRPIAPRGDLWPEEVKIVDLYEKAKQSAVAVYTLRGNQEMGSGSGFVWDDEGRVVTNAHVVAGGSSFRVRLSDQTTVRADLIADYPPKDVAVLVLHGVQKGRLKPIPLGRSDDLKVGQYTFAIGGPYGLEQTLTRGIVSALGREIPLEGGGAIKGVVQTDAAINPGNSGGPLLDSSGRLIGMNTAILSKSGASAGIGFAVPVDEINQVVPQLIKNRKVVRPTLGVAFYPESSSRQAGLPGLVIREVFPDTPAAAAGLRAWTDQEPGDIILEADGTEVNLVRELVAILATKKPGDVLKLVILRDKKRVPLDVRLGDPE